MSMLKKWGFWKHLSMLELFVIDGATTRLLYSCMRQCCCHTGNVLNSRNCSAGMQHFISILNTIILRLVGTTVMLHACGKPRQLRHVEDDWDK